MVIGIVKFFSLVYCPFPDDVIDGLSAISRCRCQVTGGDCVHLIRRNIKPLPIFQPCVESKSGSTVKATQHQLKDPGADHSELPCPLGKRRGDLVGKRNTLRRITLRKT